MIWLRVAQGVLCAIEICGLYYLLQVFFDKRNNKAWSNILWFLSGVFIWGLTVYHRETVAMYSRYYMIFCIVLATIFSVCFYKIRVTKSFLISILYFESIYFIDLLLGYLGQTLFFVDEFIDKVQFSITIERVTVMLICRTILIVILLFCVRQKNRVQGIFIKYQVIFAGFVILEYLGLFSCERIFYPVIRDDRKTDIVLAMFPMLIALILILIVLYVIYTEKINEIKFASGQNEMIEKNYNNMIALYQKRDRIYHDMKNHLSVLSLLISDKDLERAEEYISKIISPIVQLENKKYSGNRIVDIILNDKYEKASEADISFEINVCPLEDKVIQDIDWCSILSNLLDNAIEACKEVEDGKRTIKVNIVQNECAVFVKVINTYNGLISFSNGKILSHKKEKGMHGLGMESIKCTVEKYNGLLEYKWDEDIFIVNISLFT